MGTSASRTADDAPEDAPERTPEADLCHRIASLYEHLSGQDSLAPAPAVDELFGELVRTCLRTDSAAAPPVLADPRIRRLLPDLLRICSEAESLLERVWARRVLTADDPWAELCRFPYLENYRSLTRLEVHSLAGAGAGHEAWPARRVCFLGGGPLPLSAVLMHREAGVPVDVVDCSADAVGLARRLVARLDQAPGIRVLQADAACAGDMARVLDGCDVVVLAALVGRTRGEKREVLKAVGDALHPGSYLVVRSAHGLRTLLYPPVHLSDVAEVAGCSPQVLVHPLGDVVNSVLVARRR